jgi:hypothetical protein
MQEQRREITDVCVAARRGRRRAGMASCAWLWPLLVGLDDVAPVLSSELGSSQIFSIW